MGRTCNLACLKSRAQAGCAGAHLFPELGVGLEARGQPELPVGSGPCLIALHSRGQLIYPTIQLPSSVWRQPLG